MAKFIYIYHGGDHPTTDEETELEIKAWMEWMGTMGDSFIDPGNPVGMSSTVHPDQTVTDDGGPDPLSGYGIVEAPDKATALEMAKGCPHLNANGRIEVAEIIEIEM